MSVCVCVYMSASKFTFLFNLLCELAIALTWENFWQEGVDIVITRKIVEEVQVVRQSRVVVVGGLSRVVAGIFRRILGILAVRGGLMRTSELMASGI